MNKLHTSGIAEPEWIRRSIEEARRDPVGLWQIVKAGRQGFTLTDLELESFVSRFVHALLAAGAMPVVGDRETRSGWRVVGSEVEDPRAVADKVVREWISSGKDPDVDNLWFAFSTAIKSSG